MLCALLYEGPEPCCLFPSTEFSYKDLDIGTIERDKRPGPSSIQRNVTSHPTYTRLESFHDI